MFDICFGFIFNVRESRGNPSLGEVASPRLSCPVHLGHFSWRCDTEINCVDRVATTGWVRQSVAEMLTHAKPESHTLRHTQTHTHAYNHTGWTAERHKWQTQTHLPAIRQIFHVHLSLSFCFIPSFSLSLCHEHLTRFVYLSRRIARLWRPVCVWISSLANPKKLPWKAKKEKRNQC